MLSRYFKALAVLYFAVALYPDFRHSVERGYWYGLELAGADPECIADAVYYELSTWSCLRENY